MTDEGVRPRVEGWCPACRCMVLLIRQARHEGFKKVSDEVKCASCGRIFVPDELAIPPATPQRPVIFSDADRPRDPDPFARDERGRLCRYCRHYVVNPFRQWCGWHRRDVAATDTCPQFHSKDGAEDEKREPLF